MEAPTQTLYRFFVLDSRSAGPRFDSTHAALRWVSFADDCTQVGAPTSGGLVQKSTAGRRIESSVTGRRAPRRAALLRGLSAAEQRSIALHAYAIACCSNALQRRVEALRPRRSAALLVDVHETGFFHKPGALHRREPLGWRRRSVDGSLHGRGVRTSEARRCGDVFRMTRR